MLSFTRNLSVRMPLAHFTIKHFQCKQKYPLTPGNLQEIFSTALMPRDRLLRQSSTGGGATRVLVLDRMQQVKGVYHPLLCLPHPAVVPGGDSALGITVGHYLDMIKPKEKANLPTTLVVISHPYGIGFASYASDGSLRMPVRNLSAPPELVEKQIKYQQQLQQEQQDSPPDEPPPLLDAGATAPSPLATPEYIASIMAAITETFHTHLSECSTFFFVTRDKTASLRLSELRQEEERLIKAGNPKPCAIPFNDKRWVALPDSILQSDRQVSLYTRDKRTKERIVSQEGLTAAVTHGKVELEGWVKGETRPASQAPASSG